MLLDVTWTPDRWVRYAPWMATDPRQTFVTALDEALTSDRLVKLTLGAPCGPDATLKNVRGRPVQLSAGPRLQLVWRHDTRDLTRNHPHHEGVQEVQRLLGEHFGSGHLTTTEGSLQLQRRKKGWQLSRGPAQHAAPQTKAHDRTKQRAATLDPRWMTALGVLDGRGKPKRGKERKRKQILRFTEVLGHFLGEDSRPSEVLDMGCGGGALTFATYDLLAHRGVAPLRVRGVEVRPHLVDKANAVAADCGYDGLSFEATTIDEVSLDGGVDLIIALHACDTATDDALARGVAAGARWIVAAPCCHREVRPQLQVPEVLSPVLSHGILRTRSAEIATDALRAALLEAAGYRCRVFEFVSSEHTDKNLMITAEHKGEPAADATERARDLARFYGISRQRLAELLGFALG
ncbi:MAG: SAM-dependent methyltransferase [Myxococcales bacterium]|nr:SAM-dependent methyltransferase [Myxococcales bacterium]